MVMLFNLKNVGATYQRLIRKMFKERIGDIMEIYIDGMVVKSLKSEDHLKHKMVLNPAKCTFGIFAGKFLSFIIT